MLAPSIKKTVLDKIVSYFSPSAGMRRYQQRLRISALEQNGYVIPGSRRKAMKGVTATPGSPRRDITDKHMHMAGLSRDLAMNSPLAAAILDRLKTNAVGAGLQVQSRIDGSFLGISDDELDQSKLNFERMFDMWSNSNASDYEYQHSYGVMQALAFFNMLMSGDFFFMLAYREPREKGFPFGTCIKLIDADLVRNPNFTDVYSLDVEGGVQLDSNGNIEGYWVWDTYPNETIAIKKVGKPTFVSLFNSAGQQQIYHVFDPKRFHQRRGVPHLAPSAELLKQLTRISEAEAMNILVSSFFTVFVKDASGMPTYLPDALPPEETVTGGGTYGPGDSSTYDKNLYDGNDLEMGYGNVLYLDDNKDITIADPKRTDQDFSTVWNALATQATAGSNMSIEHAQLRYDTSYTAARAARIDMWNIYAYMRNLLVAKMDQIVYERVSEESVVRGNLIASGFLDDYARKKAWCRSAWIGPGQGFLNPLQEAKAAAVAINANIGTREEAYALSTGNRWESAMTRKASEQRLMDKLGLVDEVSKSDLSGTGNTRV